MGCVERERGGEVMSYIATSGDSFVLLISASFDLFAYVKFYIGYRQGR